MEQNIELENKILKELFVRIEEYRKSAVREDFSRYIEPEELEGLLELEKSKPLMSWVDQYLKYAVKTHHHGFNNRMWSEANFPSVVGEIVNAVTQSSAGSYEAAPVSVLMEKYMIQTMIELVGFARGEGQMTTGSSNANMIAMMSARNTIVQRVKREGLFGQKELFAFVSADAHYSLDNAANITGIGLDHLIKVPVDDRGCMDLNLLKTSIENVVSEGGIPFFVVATMGTTVRGAYDSLDEIAILRDKFSFWLHADGAWGGAVLFHDVLKKKYLTGLEKADSFTLDFHKMPGTSLICNVLLFNNRPGIMNLVCNSGDRSYLHRNEEGEESYNLGSTSLQCGRRIDSLKWFLDWKYYGKEGFSARVEKYLDLSMFGEKFIINSEELELVAPRESFNLCFRYKCKEDMNLFNKKLRQALFTDGEALVSYAYIDGQFAFRLLMTHQDMDESGLSVLLRTIISKGQELES